MTGVRVQMASRTALILEASAADALTGSRAPSRTVEKLHLRIRNKCDVLRERQMLDTAGDVPNTLRSPHQAVTVRPFPSAKGPLPV